MVAGLFDLGAELDKLKKSKPVYALAANMAADDVLVIRQISVRGFAGANVEVFCRPSL
jgi:hypothetical protein